MSHDLKGQLFLLSTLACQKVFTSPKSVLTTPLHPIWQTLWGLLILILSSSSRLIWVIIMCPDNCLRAANSSKNQNTAQSLSQLKLPLAILWTGRNGTGGVLPWWQSEKRWRLKGDSETECLEVGGWVWDRMQGSDECGWNESQAEATALQQEPSNSRTEIYDYPKIWEPGAKNAQINKQNRPWGRRVFYRLWRRKKQDHLRWI